MSDSGSKTKVVTTENVTITARAQETTETTQTETAETTRRRPRVMFTADTVDNENMGKKSSKGKYSIHFCFLYRGLK